MTKLRVQILSDIHLEFSGGYLDIPESPDDKDTVLVLAGDVGLAKKAYTYTDFIEEMSARFRAIIYISGNHEYYHGSIVTSRSRIWNNLIEYSNVHVIENETVVIDNVAFVGATLWSDFNNGDPLCMHNVKNGMNDYKLIRTGPSIDAAYLRSFTPQDAFMLFQQSKKFIFDEAKEQKEAGRKVVVVTHMGPSWQSVPDRYKTGPYADLNGAYVSNLEEEILDTKPDYWIHGHTHDSCDYMIGDTHVVVNPRGYYNHEENPTFNPQMVIEV